MYTPEQVIELVEAAYERGFNDGARSAYDTVAFLAEYEGGQADDSTAESSFEEADVLYLEVTGQRVDDLTDRVAGLERWVYGTPSGSAPEEEAESPRRCDCYDYSCRS